LCNSIPKEIDFLKQKKIEMKKMPPPLTQKTLIVSRLPDEDESEPPSIVSESLHDAWLNLHNSSSKEIIPGLWEAYLNAEIQSAEQDLEGIDDSPNVNTLNGLINLRIDMLAKLCKDIDLHIAKMKPTKYTQEILSNFIKQIERIDRDSLCLKSYSRTYGERNDKIDNRNHRDS
jgi:hypothetical protein